MGHFSEQYITDCDRRTNDDEYLDWRDGVSSKPSLPQPDAPTQALAQRLANVTQVPVSIVAQHGAWLLQDDADIAVYGGRASVVATFAPAADPPEGPSIPIIEAPDEDPGEWAVSLQSIAIESRLRRCVNCDGPHFTWRCPEVAQATTPLTPVELGASLCGMLWCDPKGFVRLLTRSTPERRAAYAAAYIAFLRSERGWCDVTIADVLSRWLPQAVALEVAA